MSHLLLIVVAAIITFASRAAFMLRPVPAEKASKSRFLEVFPVALFVAIAVNGFAAAQGQLAPSPALAAALGGMVGAAVFKRSILGVVIVGMAGYWIARTVGSL
ncbi:MAG: AzlD domain-containing protein [Acidimicrobiia bacterium]